MASPALTFLQNVNDVSKFGPPGVFFRDFLDEFFPVLIKQILPGVGETISTNIPNDGDLTGLAAFSATDADALLVTAAPSNTILQAWTLQRVWTVAEVSHPQQRANQDPSDLLEQVVHIKRAGLIRLAAQRLGNGTGAAANGWLGLSNAAFPKTAVAPGAVSAVGVLDTLRRMSDAVKTGKLGLRATCYLTSELGRRQIEFAQEFQGLEVRYIDVMGIQNPVPTYRGLPVLVSSGIANLADTVPIFAIDLTHLLFIATSGEPESFCIEEVPMQLQREGTIGRLLYIHGALVNLTASSAVTDGPAVASSTITTTLTL